MILRGVGSRSIYGLYGHLLTILEPRPIKVGFGLFDPNFMRRIEITR